MQKFRKNSLKVMKMPRGITNAIHKATASFEELKRESLLQGKNLVSYASVAKHSQTSRNNFYTKKTKEWEVLVDGIDAFSADFEKLALGKYKNPKVEQLKKVLTTYKTKYQDMASQNLELLSKINTLENTISANEELITHLKKLLLEKKDGESQYGL